MARVTPNTDEIWEGLLRRYSAIQNFHGDPELTEEEYWLSGKSDWSNIRVFLPDRSRVLEWGAGDGRISLAALADCQEYIAYEPRPAPYELLCQKVLDRAGLRKVGRQALDEKGLELSGLFAWNMLHHCDYDDLFELARFCAQNVRVGGRVVLQYQPFENGGDRILRVHKAISEWPVYIWTAEQIICMFEAMGLQWEETLDCNGREVALFRGVAQCD